MNQFEKKFEVAMSIRLSKFENVNEMPEIDLNALKTKHLMEFHVSKEMRDKCNFDLSTFATNGNVILANFKNVRLFAKKINDQFDPVLESDKMIKASQLNAMGLIDEIFHYVCSLYRKQVKQNVFEQMLENLDKELGKDKIDTLLSEFTSEFPPTAVYQGKISASDYLKTKTDGISNRVTSFEEIILLHSGHRDSGRRYGTAACRCQSGAGKEGIHHESGKGGCHHLQSLPSGGLPAWDWVSTHAIQVRGHRRCHVHHLLPRGHPWGGGRPHLPLYQKDFQEDREVLLEESPIAAVALQRSIGGKPYASQWSGRMRLRLIIHSTQIKSKTTWKRLQRAQSNSPLIHSGLPC